MPTGYTDKISDGISFQDFAMNCARAFGACITLKDEIAGSGLIPERFEPSNYNAEQLEIYKDKLLKLSQITLLEAERLAEEYYQKEEARKLRRLEEIKKLRSSYSLMLAKAIQWEPPTPDHVGLKNFMISQIEESIRFDCYEDCYENKTPEIDGAEWALKEARLLRDKITYHKTKHKEEIDRVESRNQWISKLRNSLINY